MAVKYGVIENWKLMQQQVLFYRTHLDIFIEQQAAPIRLTRFQHVQARAIGNCSDVKIVCSRGAGKTWLGALCAWALCCLYPGTQILIVSATAAQATLLLRKLKMIAQQNPNVANELYAGSARNLVQISKDSSSCTFKNGSTIISKALQSCRGQRAKVIWVDQALDVNQDDLEAIISPVKNCTRQLSFSYNFKDYASKIIYITSACQKSNPFYEAFKTTVRQMAKGDSMAFACVYDYRAAIDNGITQADFFEKERQRMSVETFNIEYGSIFAGTNTNSAFPYQLTDSCRTLERVELCQPKNSKSRYVICIDIATSQAKGADNSIISVVKFTERTDGSFMRKLVNMRSFHGKGLDVLALEIRKLAHVDFPNCEKIIYDARGLGDSFDKFFNQDWIDDKGNEFPPLIMDDEITYNTTSMSLLHPFRAVQSLNQRIYTNLRVALQKRMIELPINSRIIRAKKDCEEDSKSKKLTRQEIAIFDQADALQFEMGNIVGKIGASGNVLYDTPRANMHKDRYSSLAMANDYISQLEKQNMKTHTTGAPCIGFACDF